MKGYARKVLIFVDRSMQVIKRQCSAASLLPSLPVGDDAVAAAFPVGGRCVSKQLVLAGIQGN